MAAEPRIASSPGAKISSITIRANSVSFARDTASSALVASVTDQSWPNASSATNTRRLASNFGGSSGAACPGCGTPAPGTFAGPCTCLPSANGCWTKAMRRQRRSRLHVDAKVKGGARPIAPPRRLDLDLRAEEGEQLAAQEHADPNPTDAAVQVKERGLGRVAHAGARVEHGEVGREPATGRLLHGAAHADEALRGKASRVLHQVEQDLHEHDLVHHHVHLGLRHLHPQLDPRLHLWPHHRRGRADQLGQLGRRQRELTAASERAVQRGQRAKVLHCNVRRNDRLVDLLLESSQSAPATLTLTTAADDIASAHAGDELLGQA
eukprot:scaffold39912_cov62-Phaeocystis_antarctica.AAC.5